MIKCPNCGSSAQLDNFETEYIEDGDVIQVIRYYRCGCTWGFTTNQPYSSYDIEEIEDECI